MCPTGLSLNRLASGRSATLSIARAGGNWSHKLSGSHRISRLSRRYLRAEPGQAKEKVVETTMGENSPVVTDAAHDKESSAVEAAADTATIPPASTPMTFKDEGPEPKMFAIAEGQTGSVATAGFGSLLRLGSGVFVKGYSASIGKEKDGVYSFLTRSGRQVMESSTVLKDCKRPEEPLIIYEFEGCPFCKKVREIVSILDLDVLFYPCPRNGPNFRAKVMELGGKQMFPYLIDNNTGKSMYESDDIIMYLTEEYGDGQVPLGLRLGVLTAISCGLSMLPRTGKGNTYKPSKLPEKPLVFWGYEGSPFCKLVKEALCELEIPHIQKSSARGSSKRQELYDAIGKFQVPYIQDPNTGIAMFESASIIDYLEKTYAA